MEDRYSQDPLTPYCPNLRHCQQLAFVLSGHTPLWNTCFVLSLVLISMHLAHPTESHSVLSPVT